MGTIGYVPVEEYIFFITQSLLTCLIHSLLTRTLCGPPALGIRRHRQIPWFTLAGLVAVLAFMTSWWITGYDDIKTFYMRAITMWTAPVLLFLFVVSGISKNFLSTRIGTAVLAILIPTVYLWIVDSIAIRSGTWHINEAMSLEIFLWDGLPLEEAVFFLLTNSMVVLGSCGFDLAFSIVHTYHHTLDFSFISLCKALLLPLDDQVVDDLTECVSILRRGSSSFYASSIFFNESVRRDLIVLYAFCRYTDDIVDDTQAPVADRQAKLDDIKIFIKERFEPREMLRLAVRCEPSIIKMEPDPIHRSLLRFLAHKIAREPLLELIEGYEWDLNLDTVATRKIRFEEDLISYSAHVASSVAECCVNIISPVTDVAVMLAAREMGVVLQLTNVARDILTDAKNGRVYVPDRWFAEGEVDKLLRQGARTSADSREVQELDLSKHAIRMLEIAQQMHARSKGSIDHLPEDARIGIRIATDGYFAIGEHLAHLCQHRYPERARLPRISRLALVLRHMYSPSIEESIMLGGFLLRLALIVYGNWQDSLNGNVKFTDVDYKVFTDAARFVQAGGSPYERATYRYTPLLAWMLIPNQYFAPWGKCIFAIGDLLAGWLIIALLKARKLPTMWSAAWLLNPMVAVISARGNCEGLLGALAIGLLYTFEKRQVALMGVVLGAAVHFKIYPMIYAPSLVWALKTTALPTATTSLLSFFNSQRITLFITASTTFTALSAVMYYIYGHDFILHTFLYHISRSDHRHNFSPYHLLLYFASAPNVDLGIFQNAPLFAFVPQMLLSMVLIPLSWAKRDLTTCFLAQTFAFVTFNKVVTSQYFMWYLVFLPLYLPQSRLVSRKGLYLGVAWVATQGMWLYYAYGFEMLGQNTFVQMWIATLLFFGVNVYILGEIVGS